MGKRSKRPRGAPGGGGGGGEGPPSKRARPNGGIRFSESGGKAAVTTEKERRRGKREKRKAREAAHAEGPASNGKGPAAAGSGGQPLGQQSRVKALYGELDRLDCDTAPERCTVLLELGTLLRELRRPQPAAVALREFLQLSPEDPQCGRTPYLCALMELGRYSEVEEFLEGELFRPLLAVTAPATAAATPEARGVADAPGVRAAEIAGHYSLARVAYASAGAAGEHAAGVAAGKRSPAECLWRAHACNPFVAEFLAFAPAFEPHFPKDSRQASSAASNAPASAAPLTEALDYCLGLGQASVWLSNDQNREVRKWIRSTLFESAPSDGDWERPPLQALSVAREGEEPSVLVVRWRLARQAAMELWSAEMSESDGATDGEAEADSPRDSGGEEVDEGGESASESSSSLGSSQAFADVERRILARQC